MKTFLQTSILTVSFVSLFLSTPVAFAQTVTPGQAACSRISTRLGTLITNAQTVKANWSTVLQRMETANQNILTILQNKYPNDVSGYNSVVDTFKQSLTVVGTDGTAYTTALTAAQTDSNNGLCGTSQGKFADDLRTAKADRFTLMAAITTARSNYAAIKSYLRGLRSSGVTATPTP